MEICEETPPDKPPGFNIDLSSIEKVEKDKQAFELQSLEIAVFDQSTLEKGVIQQVGKALTGDAEHFFKSEQSALIDHEEGELEESSSSGVEQMSPPRLIKKSAKRSNSTTDPFSKIEEYLKAQAKLLESRKELAKKKITDSDKLPPSNISSNQIDKKVSNSKNKKVALKNIYVGPEKKRKKKEKLGTKCAKRSKFNNMPSKQPGEESYMYLNSSGSEYVPSDASVSDDGSSDFELEKVLKKPKVSIKKLKKKKSSVVKNSSSDETDWDTEEEEFYKKKDKKESDDGDAEAYCKRIKRDRVNKYEMSTVKVEDDLVIPMSIWEKLYEYQREAVKWFWGLNQEQCGGILGDEMGLGKTIQMIAFLAALDRSELFDPYTRHKGLGPTLIVCPTTVMHQWVREFHKWYPPIRVAILHDSGTFSGKDRKKLISSIHYDPWGVIITSYSGLLQYQESINTKQWHYVILDEGHKIRNPKAKVTVAVKEIETPNRIILSGSPLQNNLQELWSLIDFVFPDKLASLPIFMETFAIPIVQGGYANASQTQVVTAHKCATILKDTITPYLLRRMKDEVSYINLPEKKEQVLFCKLSDEQRDLYKNYIENINIHEVLHGKSKIFVPLINLRKICNHPDLYSGGPQKDFSITCSEGPALEKHFGYWKRAGKMIVIEALLKIWKDQGHRVLLFTQGKKMLMIMENFIKRNNYKYLKLDGSTSIGSRQPLIDKFNKDTTYFVMLLTTRVGGLGVNLTGANRVVIYDPDWNPATDTQARERAWRIGQEKDVTIYRLITAGTIEEKIYHRQIFKQFLSNRVLKDPRQRRFFKANDLMELFTLNETVEDGTTETAAIFAGTGSEVTKEKLNSKIKKTLPENKPHIKKEITFSQSKIEQMKKLAHSISKKLSEKNNDEPTMTENIIGVDDSFVKNEEKIANDVSKKENLYGPDGKIIINTTVQIIAKIKPNENNNIISKPSVEVLPIKNHGKEEKIKNKKKSHKSYATFDGKIVPHLLKKRKFKKSEGSETKDKYISQDDYVLKKLFSKGIDSALLHDKIIEDGPSDYAIIEAEADKVAQDALKLLRKSQTTPRFLPKNEKKPGDKPSLLDIIRKRNMNLKSSNCEQKLLSDMISWLQGQGGTATTDRMLKYFKPKVDADKSALFKKLLESIATFYRGPDKVGYWSLKVEFATQTMSR